jgi:hypothetical protein
MLRVPVQISTNQVPVPHLGILYSRQLIFINAGHENEDIFKNVFTKKGVEYFYLSNDTNKSIAIFRETIPLKRMDMLTLCSERCGGRIGEKSVILILRKNRPVQHTFEI